MDALLKKKLNSEQIAAIKKDGNVFLLACPGSGKTRTLTYKIAYELEKLTSDRNYVAAITYTNNAAEEICERVELMGSNTDQLWIGTIHSFCLEWILKPYSLYNARLKKGFRVIDPHDSEKILTDLCIKHLVDVKYFDCGYHIDANGCYVISCKNSQKVNAVHEILAQYFNILEDNNQIDFELILYFANDLIRTNPAIGKILSNIFPYILIDEYQDTKGIQYSIISSIIKAGRGACRTFIVGDPNQAIYQSLGGYPIAADAFATLADAKMEELFLKKNYRSSARIIRYFDTYNYHKTQIEPHADIKDYPSIITYNHVIAKDNLEKEIIRLINLNINHQGISPNEICIVAPWWVHLAGMTRRLVAQMPSLNFDGPGMVPFARDIDNFWYKVSKTALTSASPNIYVRRLRWAGDILIELESAGFSTSGLSKKNLLKISNSIIIDETDGLTYLSLFFDAFAQAIGINIDSYPYLKEQREAFFQSSSARIERLKKEGGEFVGDIQTFRKVFMPKSGITISTIHGVKGLEFDTVIAYGLLQGMVPNFNDEAPTESAMKLLYVVGSRAKKHLHLISETGRAKGRHATYPPTDILYARAFDYDDI